MEATKKILNFEKNWQQYVRGKGGLKNSNSKGRFCLQTWAEKSTYETLTMLKEAIMT